MHYSHVEHNSRKKLTGLGVAVLFHVVIAYALFTGLGARMVTAFRPAPDVNIVPNKVPPPKPVDQPPIPKDMTAPPRPFIPEPQILIQTDVKSSISGSTPEVPQETRLPGSTTKIEDAQRVGHLHVPAVVDFNTCSKPDYPRNAARMEQQGTVTLQFLIGTNGRVVESRIDKSSGFRELDRTAQQALSQCQFKPALVDGKPQQSWTSVQYVWKLE